MANYIYKESTVTTKKMAGYYDADKHIIQIDDDEKDILEELQDFNCAPIEIVVKVKEEKDLSDFE